MLNYTVIILEMGLSRNMMLTEHVVRMGRDEKLIKIYLKTPERKSPPKISTQR
jgi:hypothetical protein